MMKLASEISESVSDGAVNGMVSRPMTSQTALRSVVAKDTVFSFGGAREIEESASDDLKHGMASNPMSSSRDVAHRFSFCPSLFLQFLFGLP